MYIDIYIFRLRYTLAERAIAGYMHDIQDDYIYALYRAIYYTTSYNAYVYIYVSIYVQKYVIHICLYIYSSNVPRTVV